MNYVPEPYMQEMSTFLQERDRAALFASPGLGKSAAVLNAINYDFVDGSDGSTLIVAPLRVARLTWPNEIRKWDQFKWMKYEVLQGQKPTPGKELYMVNYERLPDLTDLSFVKRIVFDELTRAKNHKSERIKALKPLLNGHRRWGLTGTPRPNSLLELFGQVRLLDDGKRLGPSYDLFKKTYFVPTDYNEYNWVPKPGAEAAIYRKIHDLAITLRASDYLNLPDTVVEDVEIALPEEARTIYRELERELLVAMGSEGDVVAQNAATLVNKLLQIAGGTVYNETRGVINVHEGKIKALKRILLDYEDENVLIATNYIHERERVVASIPGAVDAAKFKGDIEDAWNSGRIKRLVADPRSLGHGLNMQEGGRCVIWYSPTWSRETYDQMCARVARKGQTKEPRVYRILCSGTADDAVVESLREKGDGQREMMRVLTNFRLMGKTFA